jgi:hypothetical protein
MGAGTGAVTLMVDVEGNSAAISGKTAVTGEVGEYQEFQMSSEEVR